MDYIEVTLKQTSITKDSVQQEGASPILRNRRNLKTSEQPQDQDFILSENEVKAFMESSPPPESAPRKLKRTSRVLNLQDIEIFGKRRAKIFEEEETGNVRKKLKYNIDKLEPSNREILQRNLDKKRNGMIVLINKLHKLSNEVQDLERVLQHDENQE